MLPGFTWRTPSRRGWNGTRGVGQQRRVWSFSKLQGASCKGDTDVDNGARLALLYAD